MDLEAWHYIVDNIGVEQTNPQVFSKDKEVVILFLFLNDLTSDDLDYFSIFVKPAPFGACGIADILHFSMS